MYKFTKEKVESLMSIDDYLAYFSSILEAENPIAPYNIDSYHSYTAANLKRIGSIKSKIDINKKLYNFVSQMPSKQTWVFITEPWCGDASFAQPVFEAITTFGDIDLRIALRDQEEEMMSYFLTNGGKSIPILICLDENYSISWVWGPRPKELQEMVQELLLNKVSTEEKIKVAHQWYRKKGNETIQQEIFHLLKAKK